MLEWVQTTHELHVLKLEGLQRGAIGRLIPMSTYDEEGFIGCVSNAGVFSVWVEGCKLQSFDCFRVDVDHNLFVLLLLLDVGQFISEGGNLFDKILIVLVVEIPILFNRSDFLPSPLGVLHQYLLPSTDVWILGTCSQGITQPR